jgi:hypothetical protein
VKFRTSVLSIGEDGTNPSDSIAPALEKQSTFRAKARSRPGLFKHALQPGCTRGSHGMNFSQSGGEIPHFSVVHR